MGYSERELARWIRRATGDSQRGGKDDATSSPEAHAMLLLEAFVVCAEAGHIPKILAGYFVDRFKAILEVAPQALEPPPPAQIAAALFLNRPPHRRKTDSFTRDLALAALVARELNKPTRFRNQVKTICGNLSENVGASQSTIHNAWRKYGATFKQKQPDGSLKQVYTVRYELNTAKQKELIEHQFPGLKK